MPWIRLPRSGKLVWDPDLWEDESRSLQDRAYAAMRAGKRSIACNLLEEDKRRRELDPAEQMLAEIARSLRPERQTTRRTESEPVDPFTDYVRSKIEGKK